MIPDNSIFAFHPMLRFPHSRSGRGPLLLAAALCCLHLVSCTTGSLESGVSAAGEDGLDYYLPETVFPVTFTVTDRTAVRVVRDADFGYKIKRTGKIFSCDTRVQADTIRDEKTRRTLRVRPASASADSLTVQMDAAGTLSSINVESDGRGPEITKNIMSFLGTLGPMIAAGGSGQPAISVAAAPGAPDPRNAALGKIMAHLDLEEAERPLIRQRLDSAFDTWEPGIQWAMIADSGHAARAWLQMVRGDSSLTAATKKLRDLQARVVDEEVEDRQKALERRAAASSAVRAAAQSDQAGGENAWRAAVAAFLAKKGLPAEPVTTSARLP